MLAAMRAPLERPCGMASKWPLRKRTRRGTGCGGSGLSCWLGSWQTRTQVRGLGGQAKCLAIKSLSLSLLEALTALTLHRNVQQLQPMRMFAFHERTLLSFMAAGLFESHNEGASYQPAPHASVHSEGISVGYFELVGAILGVALMQVRNVFTHN